MKLIILLVMLFATFVSANEFKHIDYLEIIFGKTKGTVCDPKNQVSRKLEGGGYNLHLTTYNDYIADSYYITSAITFTALTERYSRSYNKKTEAQHFIEVSELSFNYKLTDSDIATIGILSFKKGAFSEFTKSGLRQSEALMTLYYINMPGLFYTKYINDYKIQVGYASHTKVELVELDRYEHSREGSDITFLFATKTIDKHTIKFNSSYANIIYDDISKKNLEKLGTLINVGLGYVYDDRSDTGNLAYTILAYSQTDFDGTNLAGGHTIEAPGVNLSNEGKRSGYSALIGLKKEFDPSWSKKEFFVGTEIFYASKYWVSLVTDEVSTNEYSWGDLGASYKFYTGVAITPKMKLSVNYKYSDFSHQKLKGGNSVIESIASAHKVHFRIDYLF